jgi:hypothetical protein
MAAAVGKRQRLWSGVGVVRTIMLSWFCPGLHDNDKFNAELQKAWPKAKMAFAPTQVK